MEWFHTVAGGGVDALMDGRCGGNPAKLTPEHRADLEGRLHHNTSHDLFGTTALTGSGHFWTVEDLQRAVQHWYGVKRDSRTSDYNLFHACGFSYQRTEKIFKWQRQAQRAEFEEQVE